MTQSGPAVTKPVLFVYQGQRDRALEEDIRRQIETRFGGVRSLSAHSGEGGMTTVTVELAAPERAPEVAAHLRTLEAVLDAAEGSFGEHA